MGPSGFRRGTLLDLSLLPRRACLDQQPQRSSIHCGRARLDSALRALFVPSVRMAPTTSAMILKRQSQSNCYFDNDGNEQCGGWSYGAKFGVGGSFAWITWMLASY